MENGFSNAQNTHYSQRTSEGQEFHGDSTEADNDASSVNGHKRSLSGSILSKLSFFRSSQGPIETNHVQGVGSDGSGDEPESPRSAGNAMASALKQQQKKTRKRKGSLRKTALLGTGKLRLEGKERKASGLDQVNTVTGIVDRSGDGVNDASPIDQDAMSSPLATPRPIYNPHMPVQASVAVGTFPMDFAEVQKSDENLQMASVARSPTFGDASTTDEDEILTFPRSNNTNLGATGVKKPSSSGSDSYFPIQSSGPQRHRSLNKPKSPLATMNVEAFAAPEEWDYSETEWWGWVVLIVTWVVFVVGMGSALGVWSWAWDVGETPNAPLELSDDSTLPIVGYYPALMILTGVMAWVWVCIAWVGMKYFKHAKISGEET